MDRFLSVDASATASDAEQTADDLALIVPEVRNALRAQETVLLGALLTRARTLAAGEVLQVRSGRFLSSIQGEIVDDGELIAAVAYSRDRKAHLLEYGAELPAHEIDPNTAHALRFLAAEGIAFAAHVHFPGARLAPHPTLTRAYAEMQDEIQSDLEAAVTTAAQGRSS